jgi:hypothetical protein
MKKILLFITLGLSTNAFAQNNTFNPTINYNTERIAIEHDINATKHVIAKKTSIANPQGLIQLLDSIYNWGWDTSIMSFKNYYKLVGITYDANNNRNGYISVYWQSGAWVNRTKTTKTFNLASYEISSLDQTWNGTNWINSYNLNSAYDSSNNQLSSISQIWLGGIWLNKFKNDKVYDMNNNNISLLTQSWVSGTWQNKNRTTNTFDANNNMLTTLSQSWVSGAWQINSRTTSTYNANNNELSYLFEFWNGSAWVNSSKSMSIYDINSNRLSYTHQTWINNTWINNYKRIMIYDTSNNNTLYETYNWDTSNSSWYITRNNALKYDVNNFINNELNTTYNTTSSLYSGMDSTQYYYHTANVTVIKTPTTLTNTKTISYPNPSNGNIIINATELGATNGLDIYNAQGTKVYSNPIFSAQLSNELDLSKLDKGIYFIKINTGGKVRTERIIIQ